MERKKVFVTGAGMGIGAGIALEFAKAGYDVAIHHSPSSCESAQVLCRRMEEYGAKTLAVEGDLTEHGGIGRVFDRVDQEFGGIDVYVNNAGITTGGLILDTTEEMFERIYSVNFKSCYFGMQRAARNMIRHDKKGTILTIASNLMNHKGGFLSLYATGKIAMNKLVEMAAVEFAPFGIRVNGIAPGYVDTGAPRMGEKEPTYDSIPMRRWASLEEMGQIALFLCGPFASSIDGHMLFVDGGATVQQGQNGGKLAERFDKYVEQIRKELKEE